MWGGQPPACLCPPDQAGGVVGPWRRQRAAAAQQLMMTARRSRSRRRRKAQPAAHLESELARGGQHLEEFLLGLRRGRLGRRGQHSDGCHGRGAGHAHQRDALPLDGRCGRTGSDVLQSGRYVGTSSAARRLASCTRLQRPPAAAGRRRPAPGAARPACWRHSRLRWRGAATEYRPRASGIIRSPARQHAARHLAAHRQRAAAQPPAAGPPPPAGGGGEGGGQPREASLDALADDARRRTRDGVVPIAAAGESALARAAQRDQLSRGTQTSVVSGFWRLRVGTSGAGPALPDVA
jgi:hypothetical protein